MGIFVGCLMQLSYQQAPNKLVTMQGLGGFFSGE